VKNSPGHAGRVSRRYLRALLERSRARRQPPRTSNTGPRPPRPTAGHVSFISSVGAGNLKFAADTSGGTSSIGKGRTARLILIEPATNGVPVDLSPVRSPQRHSDSRRELWRVECGLPGQRRRVGDQQPGRARGCGVDAPQEINWLTSRTTASALGSRATRWTCQTRCGGRRISGRISAA